MSEHRYGLQWAGCMFLVALCVGTYGMLINDEHDQATALHNLAQGTLQVRENPPQLYEFQGGIPTSTRYPGSVPVGSTLLDYLAMPAYWAILVASSIMPLGGWVALVAAALLWPRLTAYARLPSPRFLFAGLVLVLAGGFTHPGPNLNELIAVVALQFTNILLLAICAYFVARLVRRKVPGAFAGVVIAGILLGPLAFWGTRLKYTILAATILSAILWLLSEGPSIRRNLAIGLLVAMSLWNNIGEGVVIAGAVGIVLVAELARTAKQERIVHLGAAASALLFGVVPFLLENYFLRGNPFAISYIVPLGESPEFSPSGSWWQYLFHQAFGGEVWFGWQDFFLNLLDAWTLGQRVEGHPIGLLFLSPLLAMFALPWFRRTTWRDSPSLAACLAIVIHIILLTNRVAHQGWGLDSRLLAPILPAVGFLAAVGFAPLVTTWTEREVLVTRRWALGIVCLSLGLAALVTRTNLIGFGLQDWMTSRVLLLVWTAMLSLLIGWAWALSNLRLLHVPPRKLVAVLLGLALSVPILWMTIALFSFGTYIESDGSPGQVQHFVPILDPIHQELRPFIAPFRWPIITENGFTVFHPDYGYCDEDPSPCPWGQRGNSTV